MRLGRLMLWSRARGPCGTPPPRHVGARMEPCRARPVPFCAHGFLPPPLTSARVLTCDVPCQRAMRCHTTTRCKISRRSGWPKTTGSSTVSPARRPLAKSCTQHCRPSLLVASAVAELSVGGCVLGTAAVDKLLVRTTVLNGVRHAAVAAASRLLAASMAVRLTPASKPTNQLNRS